MMDLEQVNTEIPDYHHIAGVIKQSWSPYQSNGGSVIAIAGADYAIIACDTRLSVGYSILTRKQTKLFKLSDKSVLGSTGCWSDSLALTSLVDARMKMYHHTHSKIMPTNAIAQMLSIMMYGRRFFPYYVSNILAGLDDEGKGIVYSYDPIGHTERSLYQAGGAAGVLVQPLLDNQIGQKNMENAQDVAIPKERAAAIIRDAFISATERDIHTGDAVIINIITKDGIEVQEYPLRKD